MSKRTMQLLVAYSRDRANKARELNLVELFTFVNKCESTVLDCQLQGPMVMPREGSILDQIGFGNVHLIT